MYHTEFRPFLSINVAWFINVERWLETAFDLTHQILSCDNIPYCNIIWNCLHPPINPLYWYFQVFNKLLIERNKKTSVTFEVPQKFSLVSFYWYWYFYLWNILKCDLWRKHMLTDLAIYGSTNGNTLQRLFFKNCKISTPFVNILLVKI